MQQQTLSKPFILNQKANVEALQNALTTHIAKAVSVVQLGVGELMEAKTASFSDQHIVNHFLLLAELLTQCQDLAETVVLKSRLDLCVNE